MGNANKVIAATDAIIRKARNNPNITSASLIDEMERGDVDGWLGVYPVGQCNFSEWTAAMNSAAEYLKGLESRKAAAQARRDEVHSRVSIMNDMSME